MRTYLDHNATSPLRPAAADAVRAALAAAAGNPSSMHAEGRDARERIESAREEVARLAGAPPRDVVFTSGGSEAVSAAIAGALDGAGPGRRRIVVGAVEHACVLAAAKLAARRGFEVSIVPCDALGLVDPSEFARRLDGSAVLAALQAANNETGVIQPVEAVARACRDAGVPLLVDAVQAAGKLVAAEPRWSGDLAAVSAHKIGGTPGAGALLIREGLDLVPLVAGGAQERRRRGGTEAVVPIAGFGGAAREALAGLAEERARIEALRRRFEAALVGAVDGVTIHAAGAPRLAGTTCFSIAGIDGETLVIALDLAGFAASTGAACSSGAAAPSHVLRAMGLGEGAARAGVRVSLGWSTTEADIDRLISALPDVVARIRSERGRR